MINIVRKVSNPKNELIRYLNYYLNREISNYQNSHVQEYLKSCLRQAIEYYKIFETANIEISPLLGFYSLLNLSKVITIIQRNNHSIQLATVDSMFRTHGASSSTISDVKIGSRGTFVEFKDSNMQNRTIPTPISINDLYKLLPDVNSIYEELYPRQSNLIKVQLIDEFMNEIHTIDANVNSEGIAFDTTNSTIIQNKYGTDLNIINYDYGKSFAYINNQSNKQLIDFILVDSDKRLYLSADSTINLLEKEIIYLIFLKYSSLVRYKPKNWTEKLNNDEYSIVTKIIDESLTKFWSIITKTYTNEKNYIL